MTNQEYPDDIDTVLQALASERRRYVLYYARDRGEVSIDDLATAVTGWLAVHSGSGSAGPHDHERVRAALHHQDLPKLSKAGLVSVDREAGTVTVESSRMGHALLDVLFEHEPVPEETESDDTVYRGV